jgi:hypothetical protein
MKTKEILNIALRSQIVRRNIIIGEKMAVKASNLGAQYP